MGDKHTSRDSRRRIGFVLSSSVEEPIPSTRIAVLNILPHLTAAGYDPIVLYGPKAANIAPDISAHIGQILAANCDAVVFQKVHGQSVEHLAEALSERGVITIYSVCDQIDEEMTRKTDATVTVTDFLRSLYPEHLRRKVHVVHDGIEQPAQHKTRWSEHRGSLARPLNAVLVTSKTLANLPVPARIPYWLRITIIGQFPPTHRLKERLRHDAWTFEQLPGAGHRIAFLKFVLDPRTRRVQWTPDGVYNEMMKADIGIIPIDRDATEGQVGLPPGWMLKSENRLSMKMAAALPVVATPIPSYETFVENGVNGYLADSNEDWQVHLEALRDPALRKAIGTQARADVIERFSIERQASIFIDLLQSLWLSAPQS